MTTAAPSTQHESTPSPWPAGYFTAVILSALFLLSSALNTAASSPPKIIGVKAQLVSEAKTIIPGQTFTVALSLKHKPGFHTYWTNPGIVGIATILNWDMPKGFVAGEIQWQVPERVTMVIYNAHGYNTDALLLIDITAPNTLPEGAVTLKAGGAWMACAQKQCCNVGYQELSLTLPTGKKIEWDEQVKSEIQTARMLLPKAIEGWEYSASRSDEQITITLKNKTGRPVALAKELYFYSEQNHIDTLIEQKISVQGNELNVILPINQISKDKKITELSGLFYHPAGWPGSKGQKYMPISVQIK